MRPRVRLSVLTMLLVAVASGNEESGLELAKTRSKHNVSLLPAVTKTVKSTPLAEVNWAAIGSGQEQPKSADKAAVAGPSEESEVGRSPAKLSRSSRHYAETGAGQPAKTPALPRQMTEEPADPGSSSTGRQPGIEPQPNPPPGRGRGGHRGRGHVQPPPRPRWRDYCGPHPRRWQWRYERYCGSWHFLWHCGPVILPVPLCPPAVVRMPCYRRGVYVRHTGSDVVGTCFVDALRRELRSQGLKLVWCADDASLELYVVTMDETPEEPGYYSAVSVSYVCYPGNRFVTAQLLDVGREQVDDLAEMVADYTDQLVRRYW